MSRGRRNQGGAGGNASADEVLLLSAKWPKTGRCLSGPFAARLQTAGCRSFVSAEQFASRRKLFKKTPLLAQRGSS